METKIQFSKNLNRRNFALKLPNLKEPYNFYPDLKKAESSGLFSCIAAILREDKKTNIYTFQAFIQTKKQTRGKKVLSFFPPGSYFKKISGKTWIGEGRGNLPFILWTNYVKKPKRNAPWIAKWNHGEEPKVVDLSIFGRLGNAIRWGHKSIDLID